jgi:uncharacterized protein (DUF2147 family)
MAPSPDDIFPLSDDVHRDLDPAPRYAAASFPTRVLPMSNARPPLSALILAVTFALLFAMSPLAGQAAGAEAYGIWLTQKGDAKVQVSRCGSSLCGKVVWLKQPINPATGKPQVDDKNPNPAFSKRPIIGMQFFLGMQPAGPGSWSGQIYNADDGKIYTSTVTLIEGGSLQVSGCVAVLCGSETWTRVSR